VAHLRQIVTKKLSESNGSTYQNSSYINLLRVAQFAQIHWLTLVQNWWLTLVQIIQSKNKDKFVVNRVPYSEEYIKKTFKNPDNDLRGPYQTGPLARPDNSNNKAYELTMPNGRKITAKWSCSQETFNRYVSENLLVIPRDGEGMPRIKMFLKDYEGTIPNTWFEDVGTNDDSSKEIENLFGSNKEFAYAKPEKLIKYIFSIGSKEGDNVLDSF
jgi:adenine-specific DNA-methyltransferase